MSVIRPATLADLDTIVVLELEVFGPHAWSPRSVEEELTGLVDTRAGWLAQTVDEHGRVTACGYAVGRYVDDLADVQRVAVLPSRRRQGLGRLLLDAVVDQARSRGCDRIMLEVAADNAAALALYCGHGFSEVDRRRRYYSGDVDAVVLARPVAGVQLGVEVEAAHE